MNILILQRRSKVANNVFSLSVEARLLEIMDCLKRKELVNYAVAFADEAYIANIMKWADAIIISRKLSDDEAKLMELAKVTGKAVLLDIDDYFFVRPSYSQQAELSSKNIEILQKAAPFIDQIVVSNKIIEQKLLEYGFTSCVIRTGTKIFERCSSKHKSKTPKFVYTTTDNIKLKSFKNRFIQLIQDFHSEFRESKMVVYSDIIPDIITIPFVEWIPRLHYKDYMDSIMREDYLFAIVPLGGDEDRSDLVFHSCKTPIKYFNYGIANIPGIYSDTYPYRSCIKNGITGLLVKNSYDEWYNSMRLLYTDNKFRNSIRDNMFRDIITNYNIDNCALEYHRIMKKCIAKKRALQEVRENE